MEAMETAMGARCQLRRRVVRGLCALLCVALWVAGPGTARPDDGAGERAEAARTHGDWLGAWVGLEARGGGFVPGIDPSQGGRTTPVPRAFGGLSARLSTLMALVDVDLGVTFRGTGRRFAGRSAPEALATTAMVELRGHPFFLRHLRGDWLLAGLYASLGVGAELVSWQDGGARHAAGFALSVGAGGDVPLGALGVDGPSTWLGLGYRMRFAGVDSAPAGLRDRDGHEVWLSLSLRWHGIDFTRLPRPPELDDRER
jgi:hypothetical protein